MHQARSGLPEDSRWSHTPQHRTAQLGIRCRHHRKAFPVISVSVSTFIGAWGQYLPLGLCSFLFFVCFCCRLCTGLPIAASCVFSVLCRAHRHRRLLWMVASACSLLSYLHLHPCSLSPITRCLGVVGLHGAPRFYLFIRDRQPQSLRASWADVLSA